MPTLSVIGLGLLLVVFTPATNAVVCTAFVTVAVAVRIIVNFAGAIIVVYRAAAFEAEDVAA